MADSKSVKVRVTANTQVYHQGKVHVGANSSPRPLTSSPNGYGTVWWNA
jgi:hypothetical protein